MNFIADESTKGASQEMLATALMKRAQGRGMGATEISLVRAFDRARAQGESLYIKEYHGTPPHDEARLKKNNISIEDVEGLQDAIKRSVDSAIQNADGGGGATLSYPFDVTISGGFATFVYGTVNGVAPTNITSSIAVSMSGTSYIYLSCSATNGVFTGSSITVSATQPTPTGTNIGYPPNSFNIPIHVVVNGVAFRVINRTSLQALSKEAFRVQKLLTTPDMLPYDSYYTWSISDV